MEVGLPSDYINTTDTIEIVEGSSSGSLSLEVLHDVFFENTETVSFQVSEIVKPLTAEQISVANQDEIFKTYIIDDDNSPGSIDGVIYAISSGIEDASSPTDVVVNVRIDRINYTHRPIYLSYRDLLGGRAQRNVDFVSTMQFVIEHGSDASTVSMTVLDDGLFEATETFSIALSTASDQAIALNSDTVVLTIIDDEYARGAYFGIEGLVVAHPEDEQFDSFEYIVSLSTTNNIGRDIVLYLSYDGRAVAGEDFEKVSSVTVGHGQKQVRFIFDVINDVFLESTETFRVHAERASFENVRVVSTIVSTVGYASTGGLIVDDEARRGGILTVTEINTTGREGVTLNGDIDLSVSLLVSTITSGPLIPAANKTGSTIVVSFISTGRNTAVFTEDYLLNSTDVSTFFAIAPDSTGARLVFNVIDDQLLETTEHITFSLESTKSYISGRGLIFSYPIIDDEVLSAEATLYAIPGIEGNSSTQRLRVIVELNYINGVGSSLNFTLNFSSPTFSPGLDIQSIVAGSVGNVAIPEGRSTAAFFIESIDDFLLERNEHIIVNMQYDPSAHHGVDLGLSGRNVRATLIDDEAFFGVDAVIVQTQLGFEHSTNSRDVIFNVELKGGPTRTTTIINDLGTSISFTVLQEGGTALSSGAGADYNPAPLGFECGCYCRRSNFR